MGGALGLLAIQATIGGLGRRTGGWDEGRTLGSSGLRAPGNELQEQSGGGGSSLESTKKWISTQGFSNLGFYLCVLPAEEGGLGEMAVVV